jgi:hypothetical protein
MNTGLETKRPYTDSSRQTIIDGLSLRMNVFQSSEARRVRGVINAPHRRVSQANQGAGRV